MKYVKRTNGVITGVYANPQPKGDGTFITDPDPLADDHPEVLAYLNPPPPTPDELEAEVVAMLNGGDGARIDWKKLIKAKFISDLAHRLGKPPGQLTGAELAAERNRIAAIYKAL